MKVSDYSREEKFPIKSYGFTELGLLYNPDLQPALQKSAGAKDNASSLRYRCNRSSVFWENLKS